MNYPIKVISGEPNFEKLLVQKLCCDIAIPINSRVFAQGQMGVNEDGIFARVISFELSPKEVSLSVKIKNKDRYFEAVINSEEVAVLKANDVEIADAMTAYITTGGDLQGEYWEAVFLIPMSVVCDSLGVKELKTGDVFTGNLRRVGEYVSEAFVGDGEFIIE